MIFNRMCILATTKYTLQRCVGCDGRGWIRIGQNYQECNVCLGSGALKLYATPGISLNYMPRILISNQEETNYESR